MHHAPRTAPCFYYYRSLCPSYGSMPLVRLHAPCTAPCPLYGSMPLVRLHAPRTAPCPLYGSMPLVRLHAPRTAPCPLYGSMPLVRHHAPYTTIQPKYLTQNERNYFDENPEEVRYLFSRIASPFKVAQLLQTYIRNHPLFLNNEKLEEKPIVDLKRFDYFLQ
ncbi:MAG: hypothetical protein MHMPM18_002017 [Marteilia pararefringens]